MYRINVYDRHGTPLGELEKAAKVDYSFLLNKAGTLTFEMMVQDPKTALLARDNVVIVWSDELEPWSGYMVEPAWEADPITVTCYSIETRFSRRRTDPYVWKNETGGSLFRYLINQANRRDHTNISVGTVFDGGAKFTLEVVKDDVYQKLDALMQLTKYEWGVDLIVPGVWTANLYQKMGRDLTASVAVLYGYDIEGKPQYSEDNSKYANAITAVGKAPDSGTTSTSDGTSGAISDWERRPKAEYVDWDEVGRFGLSEDTVEFSDISDLNTLASLARQEVAKRKQPLRSLTFNLNRRRGLWSQIRSGDIIMVHLPFYGYADTGIAVPFRIEGREPDQDKELMAVTGSIVGAQDALGLDGYRQAIYPADPGYVRKPSSGERTDLVPLTLL